MNEKNISRYGSLLEKVSVLLYEQSKKVTAMDEKKRRELILRRALLIQQIHLTVLFEDNFIQQIGSRRSLFEFRDNILDEIIFIDRQLGSRI